MAQAFPSRYAGRMTLRDATPKDASAICALNAASVEQLSPMDAAQLAAYARAACTLRVAEEGGTVAGFLLAFRKGADYGGAVFALFNAQADDFIYIDRVVVGAAWRGQGIAGRFYDDLAAFARAAGVPRLVCEAYADNDISLRFHARQGFRETGRHFSHGRPVALLERTL